MKPLLVRADDAGVSLGTNQAIRRCVAAGSVRNVSIMAVAPAFDDFAAGGPLEACLGVHATINSEWDEPRWGPLSGAKSLTMGDGAFRRFPKDHLEHGFDLAEIEVEITAQIKRIRAAGFLPSYLDEHMGFSWLPGVRPLMEELAKREGLVYRPEVGVEIRVFHPSEDDADSRRWRHEGLAIGQVALERSAETRTLLDAKWPGRELVTYGDLTP